MQKFSFVQKISLFSSLFLAFFLCAHSASGATVGFDRDVRVGYRGEDIRALQKILNSDPRTTISSNGPGSPGQETDYFGNKTKIAVMKFQALYLPEVLGVSSDSIAPTGFVGPITRLKLNALSKGVPSQNVTESSPATSSLTSNNSKLTPEEKKSADFFQRIFLKQKPTMFNASRYEASPGMQVQINGEGFLPQGNMVHIGDQYKTDSVVATDGKSVTFTVPARIPFGKYNLYVSNNNGDSKDFFAGDFFTITNTPREPPTITTISPKDLSLNDGDVQIVIVGKNFDQKNNTIYSSLGNILNVPSSDGTTITIKLSDFSEFKKIPLSKNPLGVSLDVVVFIKTDAGGSIPPGSFSLGF